MTEMYQANTTRAGMRPARRYGMARLTLRAIEKANSAERPTSSGDEAGKPRIGPARFGERQDHQTGARLFPAPARSPTDAPVDFADIWP